VWIYTNKISDVLLGTFATLRIATISFVMCVSARPSLWNNLAAAGRISMNFEISVLFENSQRKFKFDQNLARFTLEN
jgi:hypothetical protein